MDSELRVVFIPDKFDIEKDGEEYTIKTKDGNACIRFDINEKLDNYDL
jgi:hypothetical protein